MTSKVLIVGVDGGTFDLIEPWSRQGLLPNITRLLADGVSCTLLSTVPPITGPAWTAALTGQNPANSGIFDFFCRDLATDRFRPVSARDVRAERVWERAGRFGRRACLAFVPMTYPAEPINGSLITGLITPSYADPKAEYPAGLLARHGANVAVLSRTPSPELFGLRRRGLVELLVRQLREQGRLAVQLTRHQPWDFFMVHFAATDVASHGLWRHMEQQRGPLAGAIRRMYQEVDALIGMLRAIAEEQEAVCIVMSDHGFGPSRRRINILRWLQEQGWLRLRPVTLRDIAQQAARRVSVARGIPVPLKTLTRWAASGCERLPSAWQTALGARLTPALGALPDTVALRLLPHYFELIDWAQTKVFPLGRSALFLNVKDRYRTGVVERRDAPSLRQEVVEALRRLRDEQGQPLIPNPAVREELFRGRFEEEAPDVFAFPEERGVSFCYAYAREGFLFGAHPYITGDHRPEGIFMAIGEGLPRGQRLGPARIADVASTVYALMGVPAPEGLDGKAIEACVRSAACA